MPRNRNRPVITGVAAVVAAGLLAGGLFLTARQGADDPTIGGSTLGATTGAASPSGDSTVTITRTGPDIPGSAALARCDGTTRAAVARYETEALGRVTLQCGTAAQGYEHIRVRHTADWQDVVTGHGSRDWDDAMLTAVQTALEAPRPGFPVDAGDGKVCYAAPVRFDDGSRPDEDPYVKVIVSATTDRVITAYPTRTDDC
ncbi:hypothetical protein [Curtobacterium aurantiacum]|uniref:Secreted protein n=1 Tax=Curtobacterium aurantiacum TaxID=3236919 RepID=A0ABS5VFU6_9MICO|nr:hypothetical protein [Curtobacterium flaccumfaciens]MBT1545350.1 hypothetical protein [Curtobacterium flaccumfaciens pv. flaccumfaciens]MBT1588355.1 hypothetical protein [Curtobacterium flaccumfaciens pv. flaccumfaciens]